MFNCTKWNRTLSVEQLVTLGLDFVVDARINLFIALLIDRTSASIIKSRPNFCDKIITIPERKSREQRLSPNRGTEHCGKYFIQLCPELFQVYGPAPVSRCVHFLVSGGMMLVWLYAVHNYAKSIKPRNKFMKNLRNIIKWMTEPDCSLCKNDNLLCNHRTASHGAAKSVKACIKVRQDLFLKLFSSNTEDNIEALAHARS